MKRSIFDIIGKDINFKTEYHKLYMMFKNRNIFGESIYEYSVEEAFESILDEWKFRGTCTSVDEILEELNLQKYTSVENAVNDILFLIEFILNAIEFISYKYPYYIVLDKILFENIYYILNILGYKTEKFGDYQVRLIQSDSDAIDTALIVEEDEISEIILQYRDFKIENDLKAKQELLRKLGQYIEPFRKQIGEINGELEDYIFFNLNKLHIRHNNKDGKLKVEYIANMKDDELIEWYDQTYSLILTAIRMLDFKKNKSKFQNLKKEISN